MSITRLPGSDKVYTSNVYLILGAWKRVQDVNALVDAGSDPLILDALDTMATGVGKKKVDTVIVTHSHSDHVANLPLLRQRFNPVVCAFSAYLPGVDYVLKDGEMLHLGDQMFEVIHTPGHSEDSICIFGEHDGSLFVGDTPVLIRAPGGSYDPRFVTALERLCSKKVRSIYLGHGDPITHDALGHMGRSLEFARAGTRALR